MTKPTVALVTICQGTERDMFVCAFPAGQEQDANCWALDKIVELKDRFDPFKGEIRLTIRLEQSPTKSEEPEYTF